MPPRNRLVIADISVATALLRSVLACAVASHRSPARIIVAFARNTLAVNTDTLALTLRCEGYGDCNHTLPPQHLADLAAHLALTDDDDLLIQVTPTHLQVLGDTLNAVIAVT